jgi:uncharacterized protein YqeY
MSIEERLQEDMKQAMKAGRKDELSAIRLLRAQLKDARIDKGEDLTEQEVMGILQKAAKSRKESIEIYHEGNRQDLVDKEQFELDVIKRYLPAEMSEEEIRRIITEQINSLNLTSEKDIGRLMGALMAQLKGRADGKIVQKLASEALATLTS